MEVFSFTERMSCCLSSPGQAGCFFQHLLLSITIPLTSSAEATIHLSLSPSSPLFISPTALTFCILLFLFGVSYPSPFYIPSVRPSIRYFQANILHFGSARLAFFNVPNVLTISVCIYLFEYADGRSSNVGLRQQRPPTITRERRSIAASGTTWWNRDFTLIRTLYSAIISHCEHVVLVWVCVELGRLSPVAACQIMLAGFPSLSRSNSVLLHLSHRSLVAITTASSLSFLISIFTLLSSLTLLLLSAISISIAHPPSQPA